MRSVRLSAITPAQTMTLPPLYAWRGCTLTSAWLSPFRRQTRSRPSMCRRQNRLSSENVTVRHCCLFHLTWLRANWRRAALCLWERQGFLAETRDLSPAAWSRFRMVWTETGMPPAPRCCRIRLVVFGALVKLFLSVVLVMSILGTVRRPVSSWACEILDIPRCCITLPYPVDGLTTSVKCHGNPATRLSHLELTQCPSSV